MVHFIYWTSVGRAMRRRVDLHVGRMESEFFMRKFLRPVFMEACGARQADD